MRKSSNAQRAADAIPLLVADVYQLAGAFRRWGDTIAGERGQTQARWQVLSAASSGDGTVPQLAQRLGVARQAVQRLADLLTEDGLATFVDNPKNLRSPFLRLTRPGKDLLDTLTKTASTYHQELAEGLSVKEIEIALVVVRKLCSQIDRDLNAENAME